MDLLQSLSASDYLATFSTALLAVIGLRSFLQTRIDHREHALELSGVLSEVGFKRLPAMLHKYAVGDYEGVVHELKELVRVFRDPVARNAELAMIFAKALEHQLKDAPTLAKIEQAVSEAKARAAAAAAAMAGTPKTAESA